MIPIPQDKEYFSIGDASQITQIEPYVLRYWESEFRLLRPSRRDSGHRKYSRKDVETILKIKQLLYEKKYTISGAKKFLIEESRKKPEQLKMDFASDSAALAILKETKALLADILKA